MDDDHRAGRIGPVVVVLLRVYYSAQIFLFGAEFTWVYAHRHDSFRVSEDRSERALHPASADAQSEES